MDPSPEPWIELMFKNKSFVGSIDSSDSILFGRAEPFVQFLGTLMSNYLKFGSVVQKMWFKRYFLYTALHNLFSGEEPFVQFW